MKTDIEIAQEAVMEPITKVVDSCYQNQFSIGTILDLT